MSTRAVYTFKDEYDTYSVYKHHDGYPEGAADFLLNAIPFAWPLPRFEASDFAAAFIAGNKRTGGGGVYVTSGHEAHGDLDFDYEISQAKNGQLIIRAYGHQWDNELSEPVRSGFHYGRLKDFVKKYGEPETVERLASLMPSRKEKEAA